MNNSIRLLVEGFFDDEIFDIENDINSNIEDLGKYYEYKVGDIYYQNKKTYAICCGEPKYFNDKKPRFCLFTDSDEQLKWRITNELVKELQCFNYRSIILDSMNDFKHIDEDGYGNTQIIKNNYNINKFPAFEYCLNLGDNVYLPAIDELQIMYLNKDKFGSKYSFSGYNYWSSTQYSAEYTYLINIYSSNVCYYYKYYNYHVYPFFRIY